MTILISIAFLAILASLGAALFFMVRSGKTDDAVNNDSTDTTDNKPKPASGMAKALAFRVGISVVMFICVLISWKLGWIHPTGLPAGK